MKSSDRDILATFLDKWGVFTCRGALRTIMSNTPDVVGSNKERQVIGYNYLRKKENSCVAKLALCD